jgi:predicted Zn-dependent peptidase
MQVIGPESRNVQRTETSNGVLVVSEFMPQTRTVSIGLWIKRGSRHEKAEQSGISHFLEHMMFRGTATRSPAGIICAIESVGGKIDAFTSKELINFNCTVVDGHVKLAFDVLSDLVLHPIFRSADIQREKNFILQELQLEADNPDFRVHDIFFANLWKNHPLGRPILGTRETITTFHREMLVKYYVSMCKASNLLVTAAGHLKHEELVRLVEPVFGDLDFGTLIAHDEVPLTHAFTILRDEPAFEQVHVCLGVPSYPITHERRFPNYVLNTILGGNVSSRLFENIRQRQGLAYLIFSEVNPYRDTGCLSVYAATYSESARRVIQSILREFQQLKQDRITDEELRRAKEGLRCSLMLSLESTFSRMSNLARQEMYFHRPLTVDELVECIEQVTAEDVRSVAIDYFDQKDIGLTVLGSLNGFHIDRNELVC